MKLHARDYIVKDTPGKYLDAMPELIGRLVEHQRLISNQQESDRVIRSLSAAVSQSSEAILMFDPDGRATYANDAFERMSGYLAEDIIGNNPTLPDNRAWPFTHALWRKINSDKTFESKIMEQRKDGSFFPAMVTVSPIVDDDGHIECHLLAMKDMTDYETLLAEFHQAQKMEAIGTLVGGIAHDFNNTLAAISGNLYLAKTQAAFMPDVVGRINTVESLCSQAAGMIQQLLTFARKSITDMKALKISPFLKEILKIHQVSIPENIDFKYDIQSSDMHVMGDISLLQQVIMNITNNACDAVQDTAKPCIVIGLETFAADTRFHQQHALDAEAYACISISDNGSGIEEGHLEHIFEPFFTTKAVDKGTGLGLAMAYGAIQSHGGVIEVESLVGKGTTFQIYLPLLEKPQARIEQNSEQQIVPGHGETILLVDDNSSIIESGAGVLSNLGYQVLTARNGHEAIGIYQSEQARIALIILDIVMPKMGGIEAAQAIHSHNPDAKILFSTGYDQGNIPQINPDPDVTSVLKKPFTVHQLSHAVRQCIDS